MGIEQIILPFVHAITEYPDEVDFSLTELPSNAGSVLIVTMNKRDLPKVVGRSGVNARSLRTLAAALGGKHRQTYTVLFREKEDST